MSRASIKTFFCAAALIASIGTASTAQAFDAGAFFDKLQAEGKSFDAKTFFDRLQAEGRSNLDAKALFDKLQAEGRTNDAQFDAKKLWDRLQAEARSAAQTAVMLGEIPTMADCSKGPGTNGRWDKALFERVCKR